MPVTEPMRTTIVDRSGEIESPVIVERQSPIANILVRAARTFLQSFLGFAALLVVGSLAITPDDWAKWLQATYLLDLGKRVLVCLIVALAVALVSVCQNALELLLRLDASNPKLRG